MERLKLWLLKFDKKLEFVQLASYVLAVIFYAKFWLSPDKSNVEFLANSIHLFVVEFLMVISSAFMAVFARSNKFYLIALLFGFMIYDLAKSFHNESFFFLYFIIVINRTRVGLTKFDPIIFLRNILFSVFGVAFFLVAALFLGFFGNYIPEFGLTADFLNASGYRYFVQGQQGMLFEKPHNVMFFWTVYFVLWSVLEFYVLKFNSQKWTVSYEISRM